VLNQPLTERPEGSDETVDVFGIPFVGFPIQRRKRPKVGSWDLKPVWIEPVPSKGAYQIVVPNVRSWALGTVRPLGEAIQVGSLAEVVIDPKDTPPKVSLRPVVGNDPLTYSTLEQFRDENPPLKVALEVASDLYELTNPQRPDGLEVGPPFEELLGLARAFLDTRLRILPGADPRDAGIYFWRQHVVSTLRLAIERANALSEEPGSKPLPLAGSPAVFDTAVLRRFQWTGLVAEGKKSHTTKVPCHSPLEQRFSAFLDKAPDVARYVKNERFGFSVTYYEYQRPRQYFPDFIVAAREAGREVWWIAETKGEVHPNTGLKSEAARLWCDLMTVAGYGTWRYLFVQQREFERATETGIQTVGELAEAV
jgi:type III restriction enzyme